MTTIAAAAWLVQASLPLSWADRQSAFHPVSPAAGNINTLWWASFCIAAVVYIVTIAFLLYAAFKRRHATEAQRDEGDKHRAMTRGVVVATGATVAILFAYLFVDYFTARAVVAPLGDPNALTIQLTGHQWWWEVTYPDTLPQRSLSTANEIHVPVGRTVLVKMTSSDVIHSFWAPNLNGKVDLIPGYISATWFRADKPGVYRAECAEFCGLQHAKMALFIVAEPEAKFQQWYSAGLASAAPPADSLQAKGQEVFLSGPCAMCHAIQGTLAGGRSGPNLTHLASRLTIAAGVLPNTRGNLAGWIVNPQGIKPGSNMPANNLPPADLQALLAYLGSLK